MRNDDEPSDLKKSWTATVRALHDLLDRQVTSRAKRKPSDMVDLMRAADELYWLEKAVENVDEAVAQERRHLERDWD